MTVSTWKLVRCEVRRVMITADSLYQTVAVLRVSWQPWWKSQCGKAQWLEADSLPPQSPGSGWPCWRISQTANQAAQLLQSYGITYPRVHEGWLSSVNWMNKASRWKCGESCPATECDKEPCRLLGSLKKVLKTHTDRGWDALRPPIGGQPSSLCPVVLWVTFGWVRGG